MDARRWSLGFLLDVIRCFENRQQPIDLLLRLRYLLHGDRDLVLRFGNELPLLGDFIKCFVYGRGGIDVIAVAGDVRRIVAEAYLRDIIL